MRIIVRGALVHNLSTILIWWVWVGIVNKLATMVGDNVRKQRKLKGISQESLAYLCNLDRSYMSRIERGIVRISLEKVYLIANVLDCELSELLPSRKTRRLLSE